MNDSGPLKLAVGVKVSRPSAFSVTVPLATATVWPAEIAVPLIATTARVPPSTSRSLTRTSKVTGVSSAVVNVSSTATGGSFSPVTVTVTVAVAVPPSPSEIV